MIVTVLDGIESRDGEVPVIIEGGAKGADKIAGKWAQDYAHECYPADWDRYGKAAGPIRNGQMLTNGKPDLVIAFKDGFDPSPDAKGGTEHMVRLARNAEIPVWIMSHG